MEKEVFLWLGLMILFLVVELATVGLTSIWLAGGALIALFVALAGATVAWQCIAFIVVSVLLLIFTRPFATRYINRHHEKTNCDELIGRTVRVTEQVDNYEQTVRHLPTGWNGLPDQKKTIRRSKQAVLQR